MKALNKISQILAIAFSAVAFVLFFMPFVKLNAVTGGDMSFIGGELAFGKNIEGVGQLYKSSHILFCFILSVISVIFAGLTFKFKKMRYWAPAVALVDAIYMLVIANSRPGMFVDSRPLVLSSAPVYTIFVLLVSIALFAAVVFGVCHLFIDDRIMVLEGKRKKTILQRLVSTLRDYKSELKKIVWPGLNDVVKNTLVVLVICGLIGAFIWLIDFGLGSLMSFITKL
jgi:preprotein translocase subunit SecE